MPEVKLLRSEWRRLPSEFEGFCRVVCSVFCASSCAVKVLTKQLQYFPLECRVQQSCFIVYQPGSDSGCTAVVALLRGRHLYVANAGDSRCVVSRGGKALDMSVDHKPEDDIERKRIEAAGGKVTLDGRVNGGLNLSRALGE